MQQTYQYGWIIPFIPLPVPIFLGLGLLLFPTTTIRLRRMWSLQSVLLLSIILVFSTNLSIQQINSNSTYQYVWSWLITNDFSLELGYLLDPLTSIMSILITTVGIAVLFYSDNYMAHDQSYLKFFTSMSFFSTSMLGLVTSSNLIQIYIFWELVGMSSYLLIGFWFARPLAANACQKSFVTNRVGDFGLLLGILGFYWITGSFEFEDLFEIANNLIYANEVNPLFLTLCAVLLFAGSVAKSAQFPLHVWLPDAMEGPTPISALIHAATMVAAGIFLVARLLPLFIIIPPTMNLISLIAIITVLLGAVLALAQKDIKRGLAYSTMSQLGYMMLALGMGSYRNALFHLITHAYSKALLFLGSGSIIHSMERLVGYSPSKSQNMVLMGGLRKYIPITKTSFFLGTLSLSGIPPLACFWSKDEILNDSWLYSATFALIAWSTAGLTAFYMFRIYFLTFEGHLNIHFQNYSGKQKIPFYSISLWGMGVSKRISQNSSLLSSQSSSKKILNRRVDSNFRNRIQLLAFFTSTRTPFDNKKPYPYPCESDSTILFPLIILGLFTLFIGSIGIPVNQEQEGVYSDILSKWLAPSINLLHQKSKNYAEWYEFVKDAIFSVSLSSFGIILASFFYKVPYSSSINLDFINSVVKRGPNRMFWEKCINPIYDWSENRAYIDFFYTTTLIRRIRGLAQFTYFFDRHLIDGIANGVGFFVFFVGEAIKYVGGGRISSYIFFYLSYVSIFLFLFFIFTPLLV
uniref:NADH-plastoquinone oxidoreductase subunit 5 n=1 Tax=Gentiana purdomii TaxID=1499141 RepID=UPI002027F3E4|nr:NADH-plastoquinone oxidoreductase subunit 5 [Gentiana purdomii]UQK94842.1 NADH-plastoquinone oxidoreductase subunit 5 [Gentiana purdomii]